MKPMLKEAFNNRLLVIDDEETVRDSFREILVPRKRNTGGLAKASSALFDDEPAAASSPRRATALLTFELTEATNGQEGLEAVRRAVELKAPFAAIFVDMRMPGWDGLKTVEKIREIDEKAEIIFVTAYSDFTIEDVVRRAGMNVTYHCKPFSVEEIRQIATKAVYEWNKARNLEELIDVISHFRARRWELRVLLENILRQTADIVKTRSAMMVDMDVKTGGPRYVSGIGRLEDHETAAPYIAMMPDMSQKTDIQPNEWVCFQVGRYTILALMEDGAADLDKERLYLTRLFLEQAAQAIENVDLQEKMIRQEKLSAVGQAISMVAHDLRGPIGGICQGVEMLETMDHDPEAVRELHTLMLKEARHSLAIVNDILDFTRNAALKKALVNARTLAAALKEDVAGTLLETGVAFQVIGDIDFEFPADESKIRRILINLIRNAAEALNSTDTPDPQIKLSVERDDNSVVFRVSDNGPGIPEDIRDTFFVPFVTGGKSGGTGLGLAIVEQFARAHGGNVQWTTSPVGTVFTVRLPRE